MAGPSTPSDPRPNVLGVKSKDIFRMGRPERAPGAVVTTSKLESFTAVDPKVSISRHWVPCSKMMRAPWLFVT
jgi:hypothetical protein